MVIFHDEDLADCPLLTEWQIVGGLRAEPRLVGAHSFHEGQRTAVEEVVIVDPFLRWVLTPHGAYRLAGGGTAAAIYSRYGVEKTDH